MKLYSVTALCQALLLSAVNMQTAFIGAVNAFARSKALLPGAKNISLTFWVLRCKYSPCRSLTLPSQVIC